MDLNVNGPKIYFAIKTPLGDINITQTTVSLFVVTLGLMLVCYLATRKLSKRPGRFQVIVEKLVSMLYGLVEDTMGKHNLKYAPYIGTIFLSSIFGTLIGMTGIFRSTTGDLSVTLAWAIVTSIMVWYANIKNSGFLGWLKGFTEPVFVMTPMNIVSEIAQPVSMAFRLFGNVTGGSVITSLIYTALAGFTHLLFSWLPAHILSWFPPLFAAGLPAVFSIYFDLFSAFVQAFVFALLTMVYVGTASPPPPETEATASDAA